MSIRFVAQDLVWDEPMRQMILSEIARPVESTLQTPDFELSIHLDVGPQYTLWVLLQTFDRRANELVRCQGADFESVVDEVSCCLRERLRGRRRSLWRRLMKLVPEWPSVASA